LRVESRESVKLRVETVNRKVPAKCFLLVDRRELRVRR
jgi:hypothetical protein